MSEPATKLRIDKWLWQARFVKSRSLAVAKPAFSVGLGDVLTFSQGRDVRVIKVVALGTRRGPAPEAQALYEDLDPPAPRAPAPQTPRFEGGGRPTKRDRRQLDRHRDMLE